MKPTEAQLANIICHAAFLAALPPPKENVFNMQYFGSLNDVFSELNEDWDSDNPFKLSQTPQPECGFSACALGWAIHNPKLPKPIENEEWHDYSARIFGLDKYDDEHRDEDLFGWEDIARNPFEYAFYSNWEEDENAAAERLSEIAEYFNG